MIIDEIIKEDELDMPALQALELTLKEVLAGGPIPGPGTKIRYAMNGVWTRGQLDTAYITGYTIGPMARGHVPCFRIAYETQNYAWLGPDDIIKCVGKTNDLKPMLVDILEENIKRGKKKLRLA